MRRSIALMAISMGILLLSKATEYNGFHGELEEGPISAEANSPQVEIFKVKKITIWKLPGESAFFFKAGMAIDADGAPKAYHPDSKTGLDFLANAGKPGNWWALVTDNGKQNGNPVVQGSSDPAPGFYISKTALEDLSKKRTDPQRHVDSTRIPYVALPPEVIKKLRVKLGDFAAVINGKNRKLSYAIFADIGPRNELGEGSIALADALEIPSNPRKGGASGDVIYVVFPGSGNRKPRPAEQITVEAAKLFESWGGMRQIDACFPEYRKEAEPSE